MAEQTGEMKSLLEGIIKRLDTQSETSEKRREEQLSFNNQISTDVASVSKHLTLTQADVDETRKALSTSPGSVASSSQETRLVIPNAPPRVEANPTAQQ